MVGTHLCWRMDDTRQDAAESHATTGIAVGLCAAVISVADARPRVLVLDDAPGRSQPALPSAPFRPDRHRTLEEGLRELVDAQTGLALGHAEPLSAFAARWRHPRNTPGGPPMPPRA